ncbi:hypothetical protein [Streptomyces sp. 147326]|uniref:hypothetical protein n=1 Tax=Streptomyces sp. 147326 TaxID=3074379 RepID=UPI003857D78A
MPLRLLRGETVTAATDWFALEEARLQLGPYRGRESDVAVASAVSPTGAVLAGRHGAGVLSPAAADRSGWRLVTPVHLAEMREQALQEAEFGTTDLVAYIETLGGTRLDGCGTAAGAVERWTAEGHAVVDPAEEDPVARCTELAGTRARHMVVVNCVGVPGMLNRLLHTVPRGAEILQIGGVMTEDVIRPVVGVYKDVTIRMCLTYPPAEFGATLARLADGRIDPAALVTGEAGPG